MAGFHVHAGNCKKKKKKKKKDSSENCPILLFRILMPFFYFNVPFQVALGGTKTFLGRE